MANKKKVLALTRYNKLGASSRIRFYSYENLLKEQGFDVFYQALLPNQYVERLYKGNKTPSFKIFYYYLKRFLYLLIKGRSFDLLWVEKELFPGLPTFVEKALFSILPPYVADYDDSIHLNYVNKSWGRDKKIEKIMSNAVAVLAGSPYLKEVAESSQAKRVEWLPTPVKLKEVSHSPGESLRVGWIGSPSTEIYLLDKKELFQKISEKWSVKFIFVGAQNSTWSQFENVQLVPWSEENENLWLQKFDLGIMPLRNNLWEKGKCSYKLLLYMSAGLPVMASRVGMNSIVVDDNVNGYLLDTDEEWLRAIENFSNLTAQQKRDMGQASFEKVKKQYTYDRTAQHLAKTFNELIG